MKLYVIRHGESEDNVAVRHGGWSQAALTEKGVGDAKSVRGFLGKIAFDKVYTSDLPRTKQTAQNALPQYTYAQTPLLREIHVGTLSGRPVADCIREYGDVYQKDRAAMDFTRYGGEDLSMLAARAQQFLDEAAQSGLTNIAAFSHGGLMKCMLGCVLQQQLDQSLLLCPNCTMMILEFVNDAWRLTGWFAPEIVEE